jgi:hypothetical protein
MNLGNALSFVFKDRDWFKKLFIGGVLKFVSWYTVVLFFIEFFPFGYAIDVIRKKANSKEPTLPEWDDMGKKFIDGLLGTLIILFYIILIGGIGTLWIVYVATSDSFQDATMVVFIVLGALFILFGILFFGSAGIALYALRCKFVDAFNFTLLINFIQTDFLSFFVIILVAIFLKIAMLIIGLGIFSPLTVFWADLVSANLIGQYAQNCPELWKSETESE